MAWFSRFTEDVVDLSAEELQPDAQPSSLLDRGRASVAITLDRCRSDEQRLVEEIADRQERLRETQIAIKAFEAAERIMTDDDPDFAKVGELRGTAPGSPPIFMRHENIQS